MGAIPGMSASKFPAGNRDGLYKYIRIQAELQMWNLFFVFFSLIRLFVLDS